MLRIRIRLILLYLVVLAAILSAVIITQVVTFTRILHINAGDIFAPLSSQVLEDSSVTFLLLGIGGAGHDGPDLTDSITYVRYTPLNNRINTLGIPRDLWDPEIKDKINSIYTYALEQDKTDPNTYVKNKFGGLLDTQIDYVAFIDFNDFEQLIDLIGGIQVHINTGFVDTQYPKDGSENTQCEPFDPDYGCRYETLIFRAGDQHLNGKVALKFVRSRHAQGDEGTDFARSKRQQIVIGAIRTKLTEILRKRDFSTLTRVLAFLDQKIKRDISNKDSLAIARTLLLGGNATQVEGHSLDGSVFEVPAQDEYEGRYVLIPKDNNMKLLQRMIKSKLNAPQD